MIPILSAFLIAGCASVRKPNMGAPIEGAEGGPSDLVFSASMVRDLSSRYFGYFDFSIENPSERWIRVRVDGIRFDSLGGTPDISFPGREGHANWQEAMRQSQRISDYNQALALGLVTVAGMAVAITGDPGSAGRAAGGVPSGGPSGTSSWRRGRERPAFHRLSIR